MEDNKAILLLSGGVDSTTLLAKLTSEQKIIFALSFDYGQRNIIELDFARLNAQKYSTVEHQIVRIENHIFKSKSSLTNFSKEISEHQVETAGVVDEYVPSRNLIFLSFAMAYAETIDCQNIYIGFNKDDSNNFPDCSSAFLNQMNQLASLSDGENGSIKILAPFIELEKQQILQLASELKVDLNNTISCYNPQYGQECGVCLSCMTKKSFRV